MRSDGSSESVPSPVVAPYLHIRAEYLALTYSWVDRWGMYVLLVAYFIPGVHHLTGLVLGGSLLPPLVFARFAYAGALLWTSTFIGLGYVAGAEWHRRSFAQFHIWGIGMIFVVLALVVILSYGLVPALAKGHTAIGLDPSHHRISTAEFAGERSVVYLASSLLPTGYSDR